MKLGKRISIRSMDSEHPRYVLHFPNHQTAMGSSHRPLAARSGSGDVAKMDPADGTAGDGNLRSGVGFDD